MYKKFADLLTKHGITAYKVSKDTGISRATFSEWKSGRSAPKMDKIQKLADYFDVPLSYFYGVDESIVEQQQEAINALSAYDLIRAGLAEYFVGVEFTDKEIGMLIKQAKLIVEERE